MTSYKKIALIGLSVIVLQAITSLANAATEKAANNITAPEKAAISIQSSKTDLLASLDKDKDGLISLKEATAHTVLLENFTTIDANEDGYVSMDELMASGLLEG